MNIYHDDIEPTSKIKLINDFILVHCKINLFLKGFDHLLYSQYVFALEGGTFYKSSPINIWNIQTSALVLKVHH